MPYKNEFASGESLLALQNSQALKDFDGEIAVREACVEHPSAVAVPRRGWLPHRILAIDGSNVAQQVKNGFPMAEASLIQVSVVSINLSQLAAIGPSEIPAPRIFHDMERPKTVDAVLPGANVIRKSVEGDSPKKYFRHEVYKTFCGDISSSHETLMDTFRAIVGDRVSDIACPIEDCKGRFISGTGEYPCACGKHMLFETDQLRFHERFNESGPNGEVHGEVRSVLEILVLLNILRYFASPSRCNYLRDCAFVLDGPLAVFGQPAWLTPYIRSELMRINEISKTQNGQDIAVFGIEKSGQFMNHFHEIDWTDSGGPRSRYAPQSIILPDSRYINKNIVARPEDAKPHGEATYFGRKVLYKTRAGEHAVINTAMVDESSLDLKQSGVKCYPRVGDIADILDHLSTYLYQDGFMPLIRAHAHAAIPLKRGADIIKSLFE